MGTYSSWVLHVFGVHAHTSKSLSPELCSPHKCKQQVKKKKKKKLCGCFNVHSVHPTSSLWKVTSHWATVFPGDSFSEIMHSKYPACWSRWVWDSHFPPVCCCSFLSFMPWCLSASRIAHFPVWVTMLQYFDACEPERINLG